MYESEIQIRVRFGETDKMGIVYYGNYSLYYEQGRAEAIRALGVSYKDMEDNDGIIMPVAELSIRYVLPAHYDEILTVKTIIKEPPNRKMVFHSELYNEPGDLINIGQTSLLFVSKTYRKTCSPPARLVEAFKPYFPA